MWWPKMSNTWQPSLKQSREVYADKPDFVPDWVYTEAKAAKFMYNVNWDYWVWQISLEYNTSQPIAEDACIRGLKKEFLKMQLIYGDKIGKWFEEFLDMKDIFNKVKHPEYLKVLN